MSQKLEANNAPLGSSIDALFVSRYFVCKAESRLTVKSGHCEDGVVVLVMIEC
jgi:hypothetical protein